MATRSTIPVIPGIGLGTVEVAEDEGSVMEVDVGITFWIVNNPSERSSAVSPSEQVATTLIR